MSKPATIPLKSVRRRPRLSRESLALELKRFAHQVRLLGHWWLRPTKAFRPVFVLATHRSGSNLLVDYINQLDGVWSLSEVLCPTMAIGPSRRRVSPGRALRHIRRSLHALKTPVRGAKLMLDQLAGCRLSLDRLDEAFPDARYLILYRQSLAEQYLSRKSAKATNQWVLLPGQERKQVRVVVDPAELRTYAEQTKRAYREVLAHRWLGERAVLLSYEELTTDPEGWLAGHIAPLLGVPPGEARTCHRKQNIQPLAERVENYREVAALLASPLCQQRYAWPWQHSAERRAA